MRKHLLMKNKFYITTPIYYPSAKPHMGHAYSSIVADFFARFKRIDNYDVFFLTGTDEHGQKIERASKDNNKDTLKFCDEISSIFKDLTFKLNLSNNDFIRTTEKRHFDAVEHLWNILEKKNYIYLSKYSGWYSVSDEAFYSEDLSVAGILYQTTIVYYDLYADSENNECPRLTSTGSIVGGGCTTTSNVQYDGRISLGFDGDLEYRDFSIRSTNKYCSEMQDETIYNGGLIFDEESNEINLLLRIDDIVYDKNCSGSKSYTKLAEEFINQRDQSMGSAA